MREKYTKTSENQLTVILRDCKPQKVLSAVSQLNQIAFEGK